MRNLVAPLSITREELSLERIGMEVKAAHNSSFSLLTPYKILSYVASAPCVCIRVSDDNSTPYSLSSPPETFDLT